MPKTFRAVDLLVRKVVPPDMQGMLNTYSSKEVNSFLLELSRRYPDKYSDISHKLAQVGLHVSYTGGNSVGWEDTEPVIDRAHVFSQMDKEIDGLKKEYRNDPEGFSQARDNVWLKYNDLILKSTMEAASKSHNAMGMAVASGSRGKPQQIQAMLSTPGIYQDHNGKVIPIFVRNSFSDGLRPLEFLSGAFGARSAVVSTKRSTAVGGDISKLYGQATSRLVITDKDCGVYNGVSYDIDNQVLPGRVLARPAGDYKAGTLLDRSAIAALRKSGVKNIVARSPLTCKAEGLCSKCVGVMLDSDTLPKIGEHVGATAAQASGEPITQAALNQKHCLVFDTQVLTYDGGVKSIANVAPSDYVFGPSDDQSKLVKRLVLDVVDQGVQEVNEYKFRGPNQRLLTSTVTCTDCHKVLTEKGIVPISEADHIILPRVSDYEGEDQPLAFLVGMFMGDGIRWKNKKGGASLRISCAELNTAKEINDYLRPMNLHMIKRKRGHDWAISELDYVPFERDPKTGRVLPGIRNKFKKLIRELGWEGEYCHEKTIPAQVWGWSRESIAAFIGGYITADGCLYKRSDKGDTCIAVASTSKRVLEDLTRLLWAKLGVYTSSLSLTSPAKSGVRNRDYWRLGITKPKEAKLLLSQIRLMGPKRVKQELALTYYKDLPDVLPYKRFNLASVEPRGHVHCYDLTIDSPNELFVLANGLVVKNTAGQAKGKQGYGGLDTISQFIQSPEEYQHRAAVTRVPGRVEQIVDAPQGGKFIKVQGEDHYVPQGYEPLVEVGDDLDEGDQLSEGLMDVRDVVQHRGLGEGRKYYAERLGQIYADSGLTSHPKNLEIVARGALNTVTMDDYMDGLQALPDDAVEYNKVVSAWTPENEQKITPDNTARNQFLSRDILHYTAGTKLNRKQLKSIRDAGIEEIYTVPEKPPFTSNMDRLRTASHYNDDWLASMSSSYLKKQLTEGAVRGASTNVTDNLHWAPRIAYGKGFGENIEQTGHF